MEQVTIKRLYEYCKKRIENGEGDKKIIISDDNEGNGYHGLFYGFTDMSKEYFDLVSDSTDAEKLSTAKKNLVILG